MSYESMAREAVSCDFPGCDKEFDMAKNAKCARVDRDGEIVTFCRKHSKWLSDEGVNLRVLSEIHREMTDRDNKIVHEREEKETAARERAFIDRMKK